MIKAIIVDDEPLAREGLANYVREVEFLELAGTAENPIEFMNTVDQSQVDLLFLDIQMPKMNGIDFLKITSKPPMVILTTAYPSYAIEGFRLNVLDYLLKPITFDRFVQAANKAREYHRLRKNFDLTPAREPDDQNHFFVKADHRFEKIYFDEILFVRGMQNYATIHTTTGKILTLLTLKQIEENLRGQQFMRIHKSYIVSLQKIESVEGHEVIIGAHRIPVSRSQRDVMLEKVVKGRLWKR